MTVRDGWTVTVSKGLVNAVVSGVSRVPASMFADVFNQDICLKDIWPKDVWPKRCLAEKMFG